MWIWGSKKLHGQALPPAGFVGQGEDQLQLFGPIGPFLAQDGKGFADFFQPRVAGGRALAALDAVQGGSHFQQLAANREKLPVQDLGRGRSMGHDQASSRCLALGSGLGRLGGLAAGGPADVARRRAAAKMLHRARLLIAHLLLEIAELHRLDMVALGVAQDIAVVLHELGRALVGGVAHHDVAGIGRDLALLVALFVQLAIDHAAILVDQSANDAELVAAVAVEVHDPGQGEVVLLARRPERGEDLVAGHDGIGQLVVEDAAWAE